MDGGSEGAGEDGTGEGCELMVGEASGNGVGSEG